MENQENLAQSGYSTKKMTDDEPAQTLHMDDEMDNIEELKKSYRKKFSLNDLLEVEGSEVSAAKIERKSGT